MNEALLALWGARGLLREWTNRTVRARYQQSLLGWLWALIQPAASVAVLAVIFTAFVPVPSDGVPYVLFSYAAVAPWALLSSSLNDMSGSLVQNMELVTKIYFPREVLPLAALLARLLDFGVACALLVLLMIAFGAPAFPLGWLCFPLVVAVQLALICGIGLACAALNVFVRDVQPLLTLALQLWFYASPIIYPASLVPAALRPVYFLNPMAGILEAYRDILLHARPPGAYFTSAAAISLLVLVGGYTLFKRAELRFADVI